MPPKKIHIQQTLTGMFKHRSEEMWDCQSKRRATNEEAESHPQGKNADTFTPLSCGEPQQPQREDTNETAEFLGKRSETQPSHAVWSKMQFEEFKNKSYWLFASGGKLGCTVCHDISNLKLHSARGVNISLNWASCELSSYGKNKETELEKAAFETTARVFRTAYYIAKTNRPLSDHESLIDLQQINRIKTGRLCLHKLFYYATINHISTEMKKRILQSIRAATIKEEILKCLLHCGFTKELLLEVLISFCSDGTNVMLGFKAGVGKLLQMDFPNMILWHCLHHRLELDDDEALEVTRGRNDFKSFLDALYSFTHANELHIVLQKINRLRLCSANFIRNLSLMLDVLTELKNLSEMLQERDMTIPKADNLMKMCIKRIKNLKTDPGVPSEQDKTITTASNKADQSTHEERASDYKNLINNLSVLNPEKWQENPHIGEKEIRALADQLRINQQETHLGFVEFKASGGKNIPGKLKKLIPAVDTLAANNADCERGFSVMNNIITVKWTALITRHVADLLFISYVGPPYTQWNHMPYVKLWLGKGRRAAHSSQDNIFALWNQLQRSY
uniref:Uncharacterized protein n=1 Tax=Chrysemys picta bellii TaxID=8478 RepID=A0A8C3FJM6_CHRPI